MAAIHRQNLNVQFEIFTRIPRWFFQDTLGTEFGYHDFPSDTGLVQTTPFTENIPATIAKLNSARDSLHDLLKLGVETLHGSKCNLVLCDISPLGIQIGLLAGLPVILVENFTWDFIYDGYTRQFPELSEFISPLKKVFESPTLHIQSAPACQFVSSAVQVSPVSRSPRTSRKSIRTNLRLSPSDKAILITMGGIEQRLSAIQHLKDHKDVKFIVPGAVDHFSREDNLVLLPHHSSFYHPDLVAASDAVIGKLGYSTVAEAYQASVPYAFIPRPDFPETPSMATFAVREMQAIELRLERFLSGEWWELLDRLLSLQPAPHSSQNGADQIANLVLTNYV